MNLVKTMTESLHQQAEETPLSKKLIDGSVTENDYLKYLLSKWIIATAIENKIYPFPHGDLRRTHALLSDIRKLGLEFSPLDYPRKAVEYSQYISKLPLEKVYPHLYVNYLGDLYGGQMIAKNIPYTTDHLTFENKKECIDSVRQHVIQSEEFGEEAKKAFEYIIRIYEEIQ